MSKSRGNLVFVSKLRQQIDPMAVRLALLAHDHRRDWEWQDEDAGHAVERLQRWRAAFSRRSAAPAQPVVDAVRAALSGGLHTPAASDAVDAWVDADGGD